MFTYQPLASFCTLQTEFMHYKGMHLREHSTVYCKLFEVENFHGFCGIPTNHETFATNIVQSRMLNHAST